MFDNSRLDASDAASPAAIDRGGAQSFEPHEAHYRCRFGAQRLADADLARALAHVSLTHFFVLDPSEGTYQDLSGRPLRKTQRISTFSGRGWSRLKGRLRRGNAGGSVTRLPIAVPARRKAGSALR
jgi:hypothetical protein